MTGLSGPVSAREPTGTLAPAGVRVAEDAVVIEGEVVDRPAPTRAAAYLSATARNDPAGAGIRPDPAARSLFARAFRLAVRRRFRPDDPIAEITRSARAAVRRHAGLARTDVALSGLEVEMLIRDALGEPVPIDDIPADRLLASHVLVFGALCDELAMADEEIDELIAVADRAPGTREGGPPRG